MSQGIPIQQIGAWIREEREKQGKSQEECAVFAGMSQTTWSRLERCTNVRMDKLSKAMKLLGYDYKFQFVDQESGEIL